MSANRSAQATLDPMGGLVGPCAGSLLAHDHQRGRAARGPSHARVVPSNSDWLMLYPLRQSIGGCRVSSHGICQHLRVVASIADARTFHPVQASGANRLPAHILTGQQFQQAVADPVFHLARVLPSSPSSAGFETSEKAFDGWTKTNFGRDQK